MPDGTYVSVLIKPGLREAARAALIEDAKAGRELDPERAHLVRVVEYTVPDRDSGELICLITSITAPAAARADELASAYHQRWEEGSGNDQLKTHLRGPGRILRLHLPDLVHQEIWAFLLTRHALAALIGRAAAAADIDRDRVSFARALNIVRRSSTGTAAFPPDRWARIEREIAAELTVRRALNPERRHRSYPRAVKRACHNQYRVKKKTDSSLRHAAPPTVRMANKPRPAPGHAGHKPSILELTA
jgi:hypothetical protein